MEPIRIDIEASFSSTERVKEGELREIYRLALKEGVLDDDNALLDSFNELVETMIIPELMDRWDFDWSGIQQSELFAIIRSFAEEEPPVIPEIPGQLGLIDRDKLAP